MYCVESMYPYCPGFLNLRMVGQIGLGRYLVCLWSLCDVNVGKATRFTDRVKDKPRETLTHT